MSNTRTTLRVEIARLWREMARETAERRDRIERETMDAIRRDDPWRVNGSAREKLQS